MTSISSHICGDKRAHLRKSCSSVLLVLTILIWAEESRKLQQAESIQTSLTHCLKSLKSGFQIGWFPSKCSDGRNHWSAPAALLARFLGDARGEALSEKWDSRYQVLALLHSRLNYCRNTNMWTYSWRWESPEGSSWCQHHSSRRCLSPLSEGSSSSVGTQWKDFYCQTPAILITV